MAWSLRVSSVLDALNGADGAIVSDPTNVRYISGFAGAYRGACVVAPDYLATVFDRRGQLPEMRPEAFDEPQPADIQSIVQAVGDFEGVLAYEDGHLTVRDVEELNALLGNRVRLVPGSGVIDAMREIKDPDEIGQIEVAAQIADAVLTFLANMRWQGETERTIAIAIEQRMIELGAEGPAFPSIVAKAPGNAMPHAIGGSSRIEQGDLVLIDIGARYSGYVSDITRMFSVGPVSDEISSRYSVLLDAQMRGLDAIRVGAETGAVDSAARAVLKDAGLGEYFGHGLGHGVGLTIHEGPRLSPYVNSRPLRTGNVITVEPGLYFPGAYGLRIEDLVAVTNGEGVVLSRYPKDKPTIVA
jgi:Xaa-Pro aminopeptidase